MAFLGEADAAALVMYGVSCLPRAEMHWMPIGNLVTYIVGNHPASFQVAVFVEMLLSRTWLMLRGANLDCWRRTVALREVALAALEYGGSLDWLAVRAHVASCFPVENGEARLRLFGELLHLGHEDPWLLGEINASGLRGMSVEFWNDASERVPHWNSVLSYLKRHAGGVSPSVLKAIIESSSHDVAVALEMAAIKGGESLRLGIEVLSNPGSRLAYHEYAKLIRMYAAIDARALGVALSQSLIQSGLRAEDDVRSFILDQAVVAEPIAEVPHRIRSRPLEWDPIRKCFKLRSD